MAGWYRDLRLVTANDLQSDFKKYGDAKTDAARSDAAKKLTDDLSMLRNNGDYDGEMQKLKALDPQAEKAIRTATIDEGEYIVFH